jgi:hypothetical protein
MSYAKRLDVPESVLTPTKQPLYCIVFGDADVDIGVAQFRAARNCRTMGRVRSTSST